MESIASIYLLCYPFVVFTILLLLDKVASGEIKCYYKFWLDMFPDSQMTRESFPKFAAIAFNDSELVVNSSAQQQKQPFAPSSPSSQQQQQQHQYDFLFRAMDRDHDGKVSFIDFLVFQSITTAQHLNYEKLVDMVFDVYARPTSTTITTTTTTDVHSSVDYITRDDMIEAMNELFVACEIPLDRSAIEKRVDWLLFEADPRGDGKIQRDDIVRACQRYPSLLVLF